MAPARPVSPEVDPPGLPRGRGLLRAVLLASACAGLAAASFATWKRADWLGCFIPAGLRLRSGQDIFQGGYVYPPFQALLAVPFSSVSPSAARAGWAVLNGIAAALFWLASWSLAGGRWRWRDEALPRGEAWIFGLGLAAAIGFLFDAITNGQTDLILAALLTSGCLLLHRRRLVGAALIGIAAAAKCTPLLLVPWLVLRRRLGAALIVVVAALAVNIAPDLLFPGPDDSLRLVTWVRRYVAPLLDSRYVPGTFATEIRFNQSLAGLFQRLLPSTILRPGWAIAALALLIGTAVALLRRPREEAGAERFEIGMVLCLMLLLSPSSSKPHFCVLLLPAWAVAREGPVRRDRALVAASVVAAVAGLVPNRDLVGVAIYEAARWWGLIPFETLLLLAACGWARYRRGPSSSAIRHAASAAGSSTPEKPKPFHA